MSQYALGLNLPPVLSEDTFVESRCNRDAFQWIKRWPDWPDFALYIHGPKSCGKSHLAHIWAHKSHAIITSATALNHQNIAALQTPHVIEDIENTTDEECLLHHFNLSKEQGHGLLLTGNVPLPKLPLTLPDVTSRLRALPSAQITQADDDVLAAALRKQFADRQLKVNDDIIHYLLPRIDRSFYKINMLVDRIDKSSLSEQKNLTIPFIRQLLSQD